MIEGDKCSKEVEREILLEVNSSQESINDMQNIEEITATDDYSNESLKCSDDQRKEDVIDDDTVGEYNTNNNECTEEEEIIINTDMDTQNSTLNSKSTSSGTLRKQKSRAKSKLVDTILSFGNFEDQCSLLESFLHASQLKDHFKKLQIMNPDDKVKIDSFNNLAHIMSHSSPTKKGNIQSDKKMFQECVLASIAGTESTTNENDSVVSKSSKSIRSLKNNVLTT